MILNTVIGKYMNAKVDMIEEDMKGLDELDE